MLDLLRFENEVLNLEKIAITKEPSIIFYGSSTFNFWKTDDIKRLLQRNNIINLGFGGSTAVEAFHYSERLLLKHNASAVCYYEGDNDSILGLTPQDSFRYTKLTLDNLTVPVFIVSTKHSPSRKVGIPFMNEFNRLCLEYCNTKNNFYFVDLNKYLYKNNVIDETLFLDDRLHLNSMGYKLLANELLNSFKLASL